MSSDNCLLDCQKTDLITIVMFTTKYHLSLILLLTVYSILYNINLLDLKEKTVNNITKILYYTWTIFTVLIIILPHTVINEGTILDNYGMAYDVAIAGLIMYLIALIITTVMVMLRKTSIRKNNPFYITYITLYRRTYSESVHAFGNI